MGKGETLCWRAACRVFSRCIVRVAPQRDARLLASDAGRAVLGVETLGGVSAESFSGLKASSPEARDEIRRPMLLTLAA